ncbi:hypothetical protein WJX72_002571 [[Myrmecia] bisecta]|uniref:J domain-containing protein n=1 Tax=[Myrmecia] bisecta TaxID=41462 RepID=A0AAW1QED6_9CHLO
MDFYSVLGVPRSASQADIKAAFRELAHRWHPDKQANLSATEKQQAAARFKEIKDAYDILGKDDARAVYNTSGRSAAYAAQQQAASGSYAGQAAYTYRARSGWSNFRYQQRTYNCHGWFFNIFSAVARGSTRVDGMFHLAMGGILIGGVLLFDTFGESLWASANKGKLFKDVEVQNKRQEILRQGRQLAAKPSRAASEPAPFHMTPPMLLVASQKHEMPLLLCHCQDIKQLAVFRQRAQISQEQAAAQHVKHRAAPSSGARHATGAKLLTHVCYVYMVSILVLALLLSVKRF